LQPLIVRADARTLPLADASVDLVVTSPPYFALRSYTDGGEHYAGQIGDEPTPAAFVESLLDVTRECMRVLKPSGSIWVNLGDKYAGGDGSPGGPSRLQGGKKQRAAQGNGRIATGARQKSLIGIPWRYALRCIDDLGLILRAEVIWSKPNGLPESVTDRVRRSHEQWFHFVKEPRYYSAVDEIREAYSARPEALSAARIRATALDVSGNYSDSSGRQDGSRHVSGGFLGMGNPLGKLPGSVWEIPTQPLKVPEHLGVDHFAAFPMEWPRRIIQGWSPSGICTECGEGRQPVAERRTEHAGGRRVGATAGHISMVEGQPDGRQGARLAMVATITGRTCACAEPTAPTRPSVVLDPFGGTGTTALVARSLGRQAVHVDLSRDYCRLADWRTNDPGELARAMQVEKPPPAPEDMDSLLDLLG
jgi:DNA modification methylase